MIILLSFKIFLIEKIVKIRRKKKIDLSYCLEIFFNTATNIIKNTHFDWVEWATTLIY